MVTGMAFAGTGLLASASGRGASGVGVWLGIDGDHARRRAGRRGSRLCLQFGDTARRAEQCERDGLGPELVELVGGCLIADAALQGCYQFVQRVGDAWLRCACPAYTRVRAPSARAKWQKSQKLLQTGEVLPMI